MEVGDCASFIDNYNVERYKEEYGDNYLQYIARQYLIDTDYIANKIIEYQFLKKELDKDYTEILQQREEARNIIRNFESNEE